MEFVPGNEDKKHSEAPKGKKSRTSSSSDSSFDEDFFLLDENRPRKSNVGNSGFLQLDANGNLVSDVGSVAPSTPSDVSALSPESNPSSKSAKKNPQLQVMERSEQPDPNRIPSTVFTRTKSTAPPEWSVASNESLFSIHVGNNSFSKDQAFLLDKSQELGRPDDMFKFPNSTSVDVAYSSNTTARDLMNLSDSPPPAAPNNKSSDLVVAEAAAETMKDVLRANAEDLNKEKTPAEGVRLSAASPRSSGSGTSVVSFAFPILTKDGTKSRSVKVDPENLTKKKVEPEQQQEQLQQPQEPQSQPQTPTSAPNAGATKWFSCFSCSFCR